jgi:hypothetical protein
MPVQEKRQRPGVGFQVLGFHPVDRDTAIMNSLSPGRGLGRSRHELRKGSHGISGYSLMRVSG